METLWNREMLESLDSVDCPEEDVGSTTFLWNAFCKGRHVDIEFGVKASCKAESESFSAHKLVLAMWSSYFADRFYGNGRQMENIIFFEDVDPTAFKTMLGYMYGYHYFPKSVKEARELHKVALKFEVASLAQRAQNIVSQTKPDVSNVFDLLEVSAYMQNENLYRRCLKLISDKTSEALNSYPLTEICPSRLQLILDSPQLSLDSEYELLKFIYAWGKQRFFNNSECSNAREAVDEFLPKLNFLALTNQQFAEFHKNHPDFLEDSEVISIFMNIAIAGSWPMPDWYNDKTEWRIYTRK